MNTKTVSWCDTIRWMAPAGGARHDDGIYHDREWWENYFDDRFKKLEERYEPDGFMLLENQLMDSHKFGRRFVLPFGGKSSNRTIPDHPFSIDGTASGTVCVVGVYHRNKEPIESDEPSRSDQTA